MQVIRVRCAQSHKTGYAENLIASHAQQLIPSAPPAAAKANVATCLPWLASGGTPSF